MIYLNPNITVNSTGGVISRISTAASRKNLIELTVLINDSSDYSPYYFSVIRKPIELKLGGNILEFSPPRGRFKLNSEIKFEVVDSQNNPLSYEMLPTKSGTSSTRVCISIYDTAITGPAIITLVGEALVDECGCPVPEEWQGKPNVRWTTQAVVRTDDVSDIIEYDTAPVATIIETKIPWQYATFEDVYNANPLDPGQPYTVSGSYFSKYDSTPTGSTGFMGGPGTGRFTYQKGSLQTANPVGQEQGIIDVYEGNLRFSSSMVGGKIYVSGSQIHSGSYMGCSIQPFYGYSSYYGHRGYLPNYEGTIVSVLSATQVIVTPWYYYIPWVDSKEQGLNVSRPANCFVAHKGGIVTWTESSASVSYTDPTIPDPPGTMTSIVKTIEQHTSYIDVQLTGLKPICGVATDIELYIKSNRVEGPLTKLTEFSIEANNILIDDKAVTDTGNNKPFTDVGTFNNQSQLDDQWATGGSPSPVEVQVEFDNETLINSANVYVKLEVTKYEQPAGYGTLTHVGQHQISAEFDANVSYFIEFDAKGDESEYAINKNLLAKMDVYISGSNISPTNIMVPSEAVLGQYIGTLENTVKAQLYRGNSFEFKNINKSPGSIIFVLRQGQWWISNIKIKPCVNPPNITGTTPQSARALIPMPAITKFNDEYTFEFRYKNKNTTANKVSIVGPVQFEGNDPSAFMAGQPNQSILTAWYNGYAALTSSKQVHITGSLHVAGNIYSQEFHTNIVSSSILFDEGDTVFGNSMDDIHITTGSIYVTSSYIENITNDYRIKLPTNNRSFYIFKGNVTQSGTIRIDEENSGHPGLIFTAYSDIGHIKNGADEAVILVHKDDRNLYFYDKGDEYIVGDGTDLTISSGNLIQFSGYGSTDPGIIFDCSSVNKRGLIQNGAGNTVVVLDPDERSLYFYDKGDEWIAGDGTDLTISSGNAIKLNPTTAILVDTNKPINFRNDKSNILSSTDGHLQLTADKGIHLRGHVTASGTDATIANRANISASGHLYASTSNAAGQPYLTVLVDTGSGQFYYTGSYGVGGVEGVGFPYSGSDSLKNIPPQAVITGSLFLSGSGHITASGDISASGNIYGDNIYTDNIYSAPGTSITLNNATYTTNLTVQNGAIFRTTGNVELGNTINDTIEIDGHVTASGNISASGLLYISASEDSDTESKVLVRDSNTGRVYYTGSYGGGGSMTSFTVAGSDGTEQTITDGNKLTLTAGDGIDTTASATDIVTIAVDVSDLHGTGLKEEATNLLALELHDLPVISAIIDASSDSIAIIDKSDSNKSVKQDIVGLATSMTGSGIGSDGGQFYIDVADAGMQVTHDYYHYVTFVDTKEGENELQTSVALTFNPFRGVLKTGHSVYIHVSGSVTASKNIWISGSLAKGGNFISASNLISSGHITASGNISASGYISASKVIAKTFYGDASKLSNVGLDRGSDVLGDILYHDSSNYTRLGRGAKTQILQIGDSNIPEWVDRPTGGSVAHGSDKYVQFNDGGTNLGSDSAFQYSKAIDALTVGGIILSGSVGASEVTISNARGQSPIAFHLPPSSKQDAYVMMWEPGKPDDITAQGNLVYGSIQTIINNITNTSTTVVAGGFEAGSIITRRSPAVYIASGSITFYSGSLTSSYGHMATGSAIFDMVYDKSGDKSSFLMSGSLNAKLYFSGSTSGRIGIGTTNPKSDVDIKADTFKVRSRDGTRELEFTETGKLITKDYSSDGAGSEILLTFDRGTFESPSGVQDGDTLGTIRWSSISGSQITSLGTAASIEVVAINSQNGYPGGNIIFKTARDGNTSPGEILTMGYGAIPHHPVNSGILIDAHLNVRDNSYFTGSINCYSTITATGAVVGSNLSGTNTGDQSLVHLAVTGSNVLFGEVTASGNISASGTIEALNYKGIPFVIASFSGYLGSFTDANYYYGNSSYGWTHHTFTNKLSANPDGELWSDNIGAAKQHNAIIVPVACKNISLIAEGDVATDDNTMEIFLFTTTRQAGSGTVPTITQIGTSGEVTFTNNGNRYRNLDITTTATVNAGDKVLIMIKPGGTTGQVRWNYSLIGYTNG